MKRRSVLAGLLTLGGGAVVGTSAFSSVQADRAVSISTAEDTRALVGIDVNDRYGGQTDSGVEQFNLQETLLENTGFNPKSTTVLYGALAVTNNSGIEVETMSVQFSYESDAVTVPEGQTVPGKTHTGQFSFRAFDPDGAPSDPFDGLRFSGDPSDVADPSSVPRGETAVFDLVVDPGGELDPDAYSVDLSIVASIGGNVDTSPGDGTATPTETPTETATETPTETPSTAESVTTVGGSTPDGESTFLEFDMRVDSGASAEIEAFEITVPANRNSSVNGSFKLQNRQNPEVQLTPSSAGGANKPGEYAGGNYPLGSGRQSMDTNAIFEDGTTLTVKMGKLDNGNVQLTYDDTNTASNSDITVTSYFVDGTSHETYLRVTNVDT
jgi:hypothetical protein